jgi:hypothetical protein
LKAQDGNRVTFTANASVIDFAWLIAVIKILIDSAERHWKHTRLCVTEHPLLVGHNAHHCTYAPANESHTDLIWPGLCIGGESIVSYYQQRAFAVNYYCRE